MSSRHDALYGGLATPVLFDYLADEESIVYTPPGGSPVTLIAIVGAEEAVEQTGPDGSAKTIRRQVTISTDPGSRWGGVASPGLRATVTIGEVVWSVERLVWSGSGLACLELVRPQAAEVARRGYRRT